MKERVGKPERRGNASGTFTQKNKSIYGIGLQNAGILQKKELSKKD